MFTFKHLRRRVSICHEHSAFVARIARHNERFLYICLTLFFTGGFLVFSSVFIPPMFRAGLSMDLLYLSVFFGFIVLWYLLALSIGLGRLFGIEEITVKRGVLCCARKTLWWRQAVEIPTCEITEVKAIISWLNNHVEIVAPGRVHAVGDMLLRDEADQLARALRRAVGPRIAKRLPDD
jgi:hypothetical protein